MTNNIIDHYMSLPYTIQVQRTDYLGTVSYYAAVLEMKNCQAWAFTEEEIYSNIREIMRIWIEARLHHKDMPIPKPGEYY